LAKLVSDVKEFKSDSVGSFYNYLSRGCEICSQGAGLVLFVTGRCQRSCPYCPLSDERRGKDQAYANEAIVNSIGEILKEAREMNALGTGITGGEPLLELERVIEYIRALKAEFGSEHHIHLYTGLIPDREVLAKLSGAGLDEIRFHPRPIDLSDASILKRALIEARSLGMEAGVEMPAIGPAPSIVEAVKGVGAFLNLNELEFSETNQEKLSEMGFSSHEMDCGARGSEDVARKHFLDFDLKVHYCPSRFKDSVQLRRRLCRRAQRVARAFDLPTEDGTLIYGVVESPLGLKMAEDILLMLEVPGEMFQVFEDRIEIAGIILEEISKELKSIGCNISLVERYPLEDGLVAERIPL
jgi:uncharacterized protein